MVDGSKVLSSETLIIFYHSGFNSFGNVTPPTTNKQQPETRNQQPETILPFRHHRFPEDQIDGLFGGRRHGAEDVVQRFEMAQVVGGSQYQHGQVSFGDAAPLDYLLPIVAAGPRPHVKGRAIEEWSRFEAADLHLPGKAFEAAFDFLYGAGQFFWQPAVVQVFVGFLLIDETCHDGGEQGRVILREESLAESFGHQQGLIDAQVGGPQAVFGEPVLAVDESGLLQEGEVLPEGIP